MKDEMENHIHETEYCLHEHGRQMCMVLIGTILNVACKFEPTFLGFKSLPDLRHLNNSRNPF